MGLKTVERNLKVSKSLDEKDNFHESTAIQITVDDSVAWPDAMRVGLLYLMAEKGHLDTGRFRSFKSDFEQTSVSRSNGGFRLTQIIEDYARDMDDGADRWKVLKFISAAPKPVDDQPPFSRCPRCGTLIWDHSERQKVNGDWEAEEVWLRRAKELYKIKPSPVYCLWCGQQFKKFQGCLAYKGFVDYEERINTLSTLASKQPTFDDVMA